VTRFALGRHARSIAPADYARFEAAARGYLFRTLEAQLRTYGDARVELRETITRKPNDVIVRTRLTPKRGEALDLSWRLIDRGAGWKVVDLEVFGLWLAIETRAQFQALLEQPGANVDTLIARLETLNFQPQQRADNSRG
jgi:ABC-type transport system involved in resistance to organic solvents, auxiliary component